MAKPKESLQERFARYREIKITVTGRKSGKAISNQVWFVLDGESLYLLPVQGSDTQWYKNVLQRPTMRIAAREADGEFKAVPITDGKKVSSIVEKFRDKYGAGDVKKYYLKFDVAVLAQASQAPAIIAGSRAGNIHEKTQAGKKQS